MRRAAPVLATILLAAACSDAPAPTAPVTPGVAPALSAQGAGAQLEDYIVVLDRGVRDVPGVARTLTQRHGGRLGQVWERALKGFSVSLPPQAVGALRNNPNVTLVEPDGVVTASTDQPNATWGLDRIDQRTLPLDALYSYEADGSGVTAYVIDTGIRIDHADFGGRASWGRDLVDDDDESADCNGHGTHVAGTVGSATWGVAKNVDLVAVRVLDCRGSGSYSDVIGGVDWVVGDHSGPSVANMSLGGGYSSALNQAVANAVAAGVIFVVAAGNESTDACGRSPASASPALTVGSTTSSDGRSYFSNYGTCLDLFAPGSSITSTWHTSSTATATISGTSMASPHVAGAAALHLDADPSASPGEVASAILGAATPGEVGNPGSGSPNLLLYTGSGDGGGEPPPPAGPVEVSVGSHSVSVSGGGKWKRGTAQIRIVRHGTSTGVAGAGVTGAWSGDFAGSGSGVTDADGNVTIRTERVRDGSDFEFCVTDVTGPDLELVPGSGDCASVGSGGGGGGGGDDPPVEGGPPTGLGVEYKTNGRGQTRLSWSGGEATVDVLRDGAVFDTVPNDGSWRGAYHGSGFTWQVCNHGTAECSNEAG